jgi:hypothetical protein
VSFDSKNFSDEDKPMYALKISLDTCIEQIRKTSPKAFELFCLLGFFPGGIRENDLTKVWGSSDWIPVSQHLRGASLLI